MNVNYDVSIHDSMTAALDGAGRQFYVLGWGTMARWALDRPIRVPLQRLRPRGDVEILGRSRPGVAYDSDHRRFLAWSGGADVYVFDLAIETWSRRTLGGTPPGPAAENGPSAGFSTSGRTVSWSSARSTRTPTSHGCADLRGRG